MRISLLISLVSLSILPPSVLAQSANPSAIVQSTAQQTNAAILQRGLNLAFRRGALEQDSGLHQDIELLIALVSSGTPLDDATVRSGLNPRIVLRLFEKGIQPTNRSGPVAYQVPNLPEPAVEITAAQLSAAEMEADNGSELAELQSKVGELERNLRAVEGKTEQVSRQVNHLSGQQEQFLARLGDLGEQQQRFIALLDGDQVEHKAEPEIAVVPTTSEVEGPQPIKASSEEASTPTPGVEEASKTVPREVIAVTQEDQIEQTGINEPELPKTIATIQVALPNRHDVANALQKGLLTGHNNRQVRYGSPMYYRVQSAIRLVRRGQPLPQAIARTRIPQSVASQLLKWGGISDPSQVM